VNAVLFPLFSIPGIKPENIIDLQFGFDQHFVQNLMTELQPGGRRHYLLTTLFIDTFYALIYGWIYALILIFLGKKCGVKDRQLQYLIVLPLLISLFDLIENIGIIYFIKSTPNISVGMTTLFSLANQLKWTFAILTFLLVLGLILKQAYQRFFLTQK
jgi:hypothetical protein